MDDLSSLAHAILSLAGMGAPVPEVLADELARAILLQPPALLARGVLAGGPHKLSRAIELAEGVIGSKTLRSSAASNESFSEEVA